MISNDVTRYQSAGGPITVKLSYSLVRLLSEQLYQSPLKAIEELVVNAYDANANVCRVSVPTEEQDEIIAIYDDGVGMDYQGLVDLWQIGRSNKRDDEVEQRSQRKQIGKFGIGKLASYTIADRLTYLTKNSGKMLAVTIDFREFDPTYANEVHKSDTLNSDPSEIEPVNLTVHEINDWSTLIDTIEPVSQKLGMTTTELNEPDSWTLALLENLNEKGRNIRSGRLKWVLRTAMPRHSEFKLYFDGEAIVSSVSEYKKAIEFSVTDLPAQRLERLSEKTKENWHIDKDNERLTTDSLFDEGISGNITVTERTLTGLKSEDIGRSHGFFIRVRDRLINEGDPLFGLEPLVYDTFNRLDAQIYADDLDKVLTASRDSFEATKITECFKEFLLEVFYEADSLYKSKLKEKNEGKKEGEKDIVEPRLVEHPLADALATHSFDQQDTTATDGWFYMKEVPDADLPQLLQTLYTTPRTKYQFKYTKAEKTDYVVQFDPAEATFWLNATHEFVQENSNAGNFLEDFATAEMLLEVYMRERHIPPHLIGGILEQRDTLLRVLARDRSYSFETIAQNLRESAADEHELEINLVVAMRALGFTASQISGPGQPDGIALYTDYPGGKKKLTLEAKSSRNVPTLQQLNFAGLKTHMQEHSADGCLLVAPRYPGGTRNDESKVAKQAKEQRISCWTVDQLARFVESAEERHLNATQVTEIVGTRYSPKQVSEAIDEQLSKPKWDNRRLYQGILKVLGDIDGRLLDTPRSVDLIAGPIVKEVGLEDVEGKDVLNGVLQLEGASQGGMTVRNRNIHIHVSIEELERRVRHLTKPESTSPRRVSSFRKS